MKDYQKDYIMIKDKHGWFFFDSLNDMVDFYDGYDLNPHSFFHFLKKDLKSNQDNMIVNDITDDMVDDIKNDIHNDIKNDIHPEIKYDIHNDIKNDITDNNPLNQKIIKLKTQKTQYQKKIKQLQQDPTPENKEMIKKIKYKIRVIQKRIKVEQEIQEDVHPQLIEEEIIMTNPSHKPQENHFYQTVGTYLKDIHYDPEHERKKYEFKHIEKIRDKTA